MPALPRVREHPILSERNPLSTAMTVLTLPVKDKVECPLIGQYAPEIELDDHLGRRCSLHATISLGRPIVLFFFPLAGSPHCTKESCAFRDAIALSPVYSDLGAIVIGISQDGQEHAKHFVEEHKLTYRILSDVNRAAHDAWGVRTTLFGLINRRCTFIIDHRGIVRGMCEGTFNHKGHRRFAEAWLVRIEHEIADQTRRLYRSASASAIGSIPSNGLGLRFDPLHSPKAATRILADGSAASPAAAVMSADGAPDAATKSPALNANGFGKGFFAIRGEEDEEEDRMMDRRRRVLYQMQKQDAERFEREKQKAEKQQLPNLQHQNGSGQFPTSASASSFAAISAAEANGVPPMRVVYGPPPTSGEEYGIGRAPRHGGNGVGSSSPRQPHRSPEGDVSTSSTFGISFSRRARAATNASGSPVHGYADGNNGRPDTAGSTRSRGRGKLSSYLRSPSAARKSTSTFGGPMQANNSRSGSPIAAFMGNKRFSSSHTSEAGGSSNLNSPAQSPMMRMMGMSPPERPSEDGHSVRSGIADSSSAGGWHTPSLRSRNDSFSHQSIKSARSAAAAFVPVDAPAVPPLPPTYENVDDSAQPDEKMDMQAHRQDLEYEQAQERGLPTPTAATVPASVSGATTDGSENGKDTRSPRWGLDSTWGTSSSASLSTAETAVSSPRRSDSDRTGTEHSRSTSSSPHQHSGKPSAIPPVPKVPPLPERSNARKPVPTPLRQQPELVSTISVGTTKSQKMPSAKQQRDDPLPQYQVKDRDHAPDAPISVDVELELELDPSEEFVAVGANGIITPRSPPPQQQLHSMRSSPAKLPQTLTQPRTAESKYETWEHTVVPVGIAKNGLTPRKTAAVNTAQETKPLSSAPATTTSHHPPPVSATARIQTPSSERGDDESNTSRLSMGSSRSSRDLPVQAPIPGYAPPTPPVPNTTQASVSADPPQLPPVLPGPRSPSDPEPLGNFLYDGEAFGKLQLL